MRNKYSQRCDTCGRVVNVGQGEVAKVHGRWITRHDACIPDRNRGLSTEPDVPDQQELFEDDNDQST